VKIYKIIYSHKMKIKSSIEEIIQKQSEYFKTGVTRPVSFRIRQLKILKEL